MCSQSCADIYHIHKHRQRFYNVEECVLFPRSAEVVQKVYVKEDATICLGVEATPWSQCKPGRRRSFILTFTSQKGCPSVWRSVGREKGILGENSLSTHQVSYLLFIMLPFYILTCFLFFLMGQGLGLLESGWMLQVSQGGLLSCHREEMGLSSHHGWEGTGSLAAVQ